MDYTSLIGAKTDTDSIKNWCNNSLVPSETILTEAQAWIYSKLRVREMRTLDVTPMAAGAEYLVLPTGYQSTLILNRVGQYAGKIDIVEYDLFEDMLDTDEDGAILEDFPTMAASSGTRLELNRKPAVEVPLRWWYLASLPALSGSNLTNFLTTSWPHLLRTICISRGFDHMKQWGAAQRFEQQALGYVNDANVAYDMELQEQRYEMYWERP